MKSAFLAFAALPVLLLAEPGTVSEWDDEPASDTAERAPDMSSVAAVVAEMMPALHVTHRRDDAIGLTAWTNYIDALDYDRILFTKEDLRALDYGRATFVERLAAGDMSYARRVYDMYSRRLGLYIEFSESILSNDFSAAAPKQYVWRRKKAERPADDAEQRELWTDRIRNSLLSAQVKWECDRESGASGSALPAGGGRADDVVGPEVIDEFIRDLDAGTNAVDMAAAVEAEREDLRSYFDRLEEYGRFDDETFASMLLNSFTSAYDPHSSYMSPVASEDFEIDMQLSLQGIGATLHADKGACRVVEIVKGSPAERDESPGRLVPGDAIIGVAQGDDGEFTDVRHWKLSRTVRLIRGPKGSVVRLRVIPAADPNSEKIVRLVRDEIKLEEQAVSSSVETVTDARGGERRFGVVRLPSFYASMHLTGESGGAERRNASADVAKAIAELSESGVEGLILDLRGNGGGSLPEAVGVAGLFIRTGPVVIVRETYGARALTDSDPAVAWRKPLVVLVDRFSASASEIVAAALQDYGRAVIAGDEFTHGKGTVQTIVPIMNNEKNGMLKATTALFYRVNGDSTQLRGVRSDIHLPSMLEGFTDLGEGNLPGSLRWTHIAPARYRRFDDLSAVIPELRARSEARTATNEAWAVRMRRIGRFREFSVKDSVSLDHDVRLSEMIEENEFNRESEKIMPVSRKDRADDIVLDEALLVLADLADLHEMPAQPAPPPASPGGDAIYDFLKSFF